MTTDNNLLHVTSILNPWTMRALSRIPENILAQGCQKGTDAHRLCAAYARGEWIPTDKGNEGQLLSYKKWFDSAVGTVVYVEHTMKDVGLGVIGTLDLFCILRDGRYALIDIKRSQSVFPTYKAQVAAYRHLLKHPSPENILCGILPLKSSGRQAKLVEIHEIDKWFAVFLSALNCAKAFGV